jgi:hypothetical protein
MRFIHWPESFTVNNVVNVLALCISDVSVNNQNIVTDLLKALLGNRPVNAYHSNECATLGRPLLGNAWVDTPNNNTWYPLLSSWCVFCGWPVPSLSREWDTGSCIWNVVYAVLSRPLLRHVSSAGSLNNLSKALSTHRQLRGTRISEFHWLKCIEMYQKKTDGWL